MKQFYPTPVSLAIKARKKFKNYNIIRLLEPNAGRGNLITPFCGGHSRPPVDCVEIDLENQAILRSKGYNVIDGDFMQFNGAAMYSHIIMNPPFAQGVDHVIKAFELLVNGELVAIVNAETVRNPFSSKRKLLVKWIEDFGSVEFMEEAFTDPDTLHKTNVEIALIHLEKRTDIKQTFTVGLDNDGPAGVHYQDKQELALKSSTISNVVAVFNAAVESLRRVEVANEEAFYYKTLLGRPLNKMHSSDIEPENLQKRFNAAYDDLKERAWTNVLHSTEFSKYLSSKAYEKLVADFKSVSKLSFTELNIRGFLLGLVNSQAEMNLQMVLDCFDSFTKYIPENRAYYRGWKSNLKHKDQAFRLQMTRFILPRFSSEGGRLDWSSLKQLSDYDKVFAMLDGKAECEVSLEWLFSNKLNELRAGERLSGSYFDVRYYKGAQTIHFFPTKKELINRMNRLVGKERRWIPVDDKEATKGFWNQFDAAEKITRAMKIPVTRWGAIEDGIIAAAHLEACDKVGVDISDMLLEDLRNVENVAA